MKRKKLDIKKNIQQKLEQRLTIYSFLTFLAQALSAFYMVNLIFF